MLLRGKEREKLEISIVSNSRVQKFLLCEMPTCNFSWGFRQRVGSSFCEATACTAHGAIKITDLLKHSPIVPAKPCAEECHPEGGSKMSQGDRGVTSRLTFGFKKNKQPRNSEGIKKKRKTNYKMFSRCVRLGINHSAKCVSNSSLKS